MRFITILLVSLGVTACDATVSPKAPVSKTDDGHQYVDGYKLLKGSSSDEIGLIALDESHYSGSQAPAALSDKIEEISGGHAILQYTKNGHQHVGQGVMLIGRVSVCGNTVQCEDKVACPQAGLFNPNATRGSIAFKPTAEQLSDTCLEPLNFEMALSDRQYRQIPSISGKLKGVIGKIKGNSAGAPNPQPGSFALSFANNGQAGTDGLCQVAVVDTSLVPRYEECDDKNYSYDQAGAIQPLGASHSVAAFKDLTQVEAQSSLTTVQDSIQSRRSGYATDDSVKEESTGTRYDASSSSDCAVQAYAAKNVTTLNRVTGDETTVLASSSGYASCVETRSALSFRQETDWSTCETEQISLETIFTSEAPSSLYKKDGQLYVPIIVCNKFVGWSYTSSRVPETGTLSAHTAYPVPCPTEYLTVEQTINSVNEVVNTTPLPTVNSTCVAHFSAESPVYASDHVYASEGKTCADTNNIKTGEYSVQFPSPSSDNTNANNPFVEISNPYSHAKCTDVVAPPAVSELKILGTYPFFDVQASISPYTHNYTDTSNNSWIRFPVFSPELPNNNEPVYYSNIRLDIYKADTVQDCTPGNSIVQSHAYPSNPNLSVEQTEAGIQSLKMNFFSAPSSVSYDSIQYGVFRASFYADVDADRIDGVTVASSCSEASFVKQAALCDVIPNSADCSRFGKDAYCAWDEGNNRCVSVNVVGPAPYFYSARSSRTSGGCESGQKLADSWDLSGNWVAPSGYNNTTCTEYTESLELSGEQVSVNQNFVASECNGAGCTSSSQHPITVLHDVQQTVYTYPNDYPPFYSSSQCAFSDMTPTTRTATYILLNGQAVVSSHPTPLYSPYGYNGSCVYYDADAMKSCDIVEPLTGEYTCL